MFQLHYHDTKESINDKIFLQPKYQKRKLNVSHDNTFQKINEMICLLHLHLIDLDRNGSIQCFERLVPTWSHPCLNLVETWSQPGPYWSQHLNLNYPCSFPFLSPSSLTTSVLIVVVCSHRKLWRLCVHLKFFVTLVYILRHHGLAPSEIV